MQDQRESELIERSRAGDSLAFNSLTTMWYEKVLGFLYRILGSIEDAQDVCQKTFITAYSRLDQLNDSEKFSSWLYRIANNHAVDQIRDRRRFSRGNGRLDTDEPARPTDPPDSNPINLDATIDGAELRRLFENVMRSIPEKQRVVVVMKLYQDLKFTEIAEILSIPVNTVKTRVYTGLRTIKEALAGNKMVEEILKDAM